MESIHDKIQELADTDLYEVLGIPENATLSQIKKRYNKLVLKYHPDKIKTPTEKTNEKFGLISEAYKILSVEKNRKMYDRFREIISENTKDHTGLKTSYNEYVKDIIVDKDDPSYEQNKMEKKQEFEKKWEELNDKHKVTTDISPLSTKEADVILADIIKSRNDGMPAPENLFENNEFNAVDFNKAFEEMKRKNTGKELATTKISAMDSMIPYASIYENNLYANGADSRSNNCAGLDEAFNLPTTHITAKDMDEITASTEYDTHDKDKIDMKTLEERMKEYESMTEQFNKRTLKDFTKDDYGDYGIFDKLLLDGSTKNNKITRKEDDTEGDKEYDIKYDEFEEPDDFINFGETD